MSRQILFVPLHAPSLLEMLPTAEQIIADGRYRPCFFIYRDIPSDKIELLQRRGVAVIGPGLSTGSKATPTVVQKDSRVVVSGGAQQEQSKTLIPWWRQWIKRAARWAQSTTFTSFFLNLADYAVTLRKAGRLLDEQAVAAVITIGDRHVGWETALIKVANRKHIPSLIVPYALSDPKGSATFRLRQTENESLYFAESSIGQLVEKIFPHWVFRYDGRHLLYLPIGASLAAQILGIMPEKPWTIGGGAATRMAVESQKLQKMFLEQGIPAAKMTVTGKPSIDQIFQSTQDHIRRIVREELDIPLDQPVILCAVPHLGEHGFLPFSQHLEEMDRLIATLTGLPAVAVVLSLHPKSDPAQYKPIAERYSALVASRRIYDVLPACDVFVAGFSSTVMHAVGVYKPTVVVDFYGLNFTFYNDAPGVIVLKDRQLLAETLHKLFEDHSFFEQLVLEQHRQAAEWILLDGQCTRRVVNLTYQLIKDQTNM